MKNLELLSPAGSFEKMKYAFHYGADAVYIGIKALSLRVKENEFTLENIGKAIKYAHNIHKKVYVTANIYPRHYNERTLIEYLEVLSSKEPDAFIVSDPGIVMIIRDNLDIPIHLSVQANTTNKFSAKFWYKQGVERIILARELSLDEIREIHEYVPNLELEFFVHGSICMTYSGRCLLSAYMSKRNPNLGVCSHSCRWRYRVYIEEINRPGELMLVEEDEHGTYIMNSKDLCLITKLKELIDVGIISFKIEGRNKTEYYVSVVTRAYRKALDSIIKGEEPNYDELMYELYSAPNRGFITSYLDMPSSTFNKDLQNYTTTSSLQTHKYVAKVKEVKNDELLCDIKNEVFVGDKVEIITKNEIIPTTIKRIMKTHKEVGKANPSDTDVILIVDTPIHNEEYLLVRKKI